MPFEYILVYLVIAWVIGSVSGYMIGNIMGWSAALKSVSPFAVSNPRK